MYDKIFKVRLHHPLSDAVLEMDLPASATFREILNLLYQNGFIQKKAADYGFIIDRRFCSLNKSLASYVPLEKSDAVEIEINGLLTIMT